MTLKLDLWVFGLISEPLSSNGRSGLIIRHYKLELSKESSQNQHSSRLTESGPRRERTRRKKRAPGPGRNGGYARTGHPADPTQPWADPTQPCRKNTSIPQDSTDGDSDHATPWVTTERPASRTILGPAPRTVEGGGRDE